MAKPNYSFEKRQKELAKKKKKEEKEQRKADAKAAGNPDPGKDAETDDAAQDRTPAMRLPRWSAERPCSRRPDVPIRRHPQTRPTIQSLVNKKAVSKPGQ